MRLAIKIFIFSVCLLTPFQAYSATAPEQIPIWMNYTVSVEGQLRDSNFVISDYENSYEDDFSGTTPIKLNKGQSFTMSASCGLAFQDPHADDFKIYWNSFNPDIVPVTSEVEGYLDSTYRYWDDLMGTAENKYRTELITSSATVLYPLDGPNTWSGGSNFTIELACINQTEEGSRTYVFDHSFARWFELEISDSPLDVSVIPETVELEVGQSITQTIKLSGDVKACDTTSSTGSGIIQNMSIDCSNTLSYSITPSTGLTVTRGLVMQSGLGSSKVYSANFKLEAVTAGTYTMNYTVIGDGYPGQVVSKSVQMTVKDVVGAIPTDADGDGSFTPDDCNDGDATINPTAGEACDGVDNNCDGTVDDGLVGCTVPVDVAAPVVVPGDVNSGGDVSGDVQPVIIEETEGDDDSTPPPPSGRATGGGGLGCSLGVGATADAGFLFFLFGVTFFRFLIKRV